MKKLLLSIVLLTVGATMFGAARPEFERASPTTFRVLNLTGYNDITVTTSVPGATSHVRLHRGEAHDFQVAGEDPINIRLKNLDEKPFKIYPPGGTWEQLRRSHPNESIFISNLNPSPNPSAWVIFGIGMKVLY